MSVIGTLFHPPAGNKRRRRCNAKADPCDFIRASGADVAHPNKNVAPTRRTRPTINPLKKASFDTAGFGGCYSLSSPSCSYKAISPSRSISIFLTPNSSITSRTDPLKPTRAIQTTCTLIGNAPCSHLRPRQNNSPPATAPTPQTSFSQAHSPSNSNLANALFTSTSPMPHQYFFYPIPDLRGPLPGAHRRATTPRSPPSRATTGTNPGLNHPLEQNKESLPIFPSRTGHSIRRSISAVWIASDPSPAHQRPEPV